jgi:hypothetical protein
MKQSWLASWFETFANTASGFALSLGLQYGVCWWYSLPLRWDDNLAIIGVFTFASLVRGISWRRLMEALHVRNPISAFAGAVLAERRRQIEAEGWALEHDDKLELGELARAGAAYALNAAGWWLPQKPKSRNPVRNVMNYWPWVQTWWRPTTPRRDLVKAAALILAEGEKFDRNRKGKKRPF